MIGGQDQIRECLLLLPPDKLLHARRRGRARAPAAAEIEAIVDERRLRTAEGQRRDEREEGDKGDGHFPMRGR